MRSVSASRSTAAGGHSLVQASLAATRLLMMPVVKSEATGEGHSEPQYVLKTWLGPIHDFSYNCWSLYSEEDEGADEKAIRARLRSALHWYRTHKDELFPNVKLPPSILEPLVLDFDSIWKFEKAHDTFVNVFGDKCGAKSTRIRAGRGIVKVKDLKECWQLCFTWLREILPSAYLMLAHQNIDRVFERLERPFRRSIGTSGRPASFPYIVHPPGLQILDWLRKRIAKLGKETRPTRAEEGQDLLRELGVAASEVVESAEEVAQPVDPAAERAARVAERVRQAAGRVDAACDGATSEPSCLNSLVSASSLKQNAMSSGLILDEQIDPRSLVCPFTVMGLPGPTAVSFAVSNLSPSPSNTTLPAAANTGDSEPIAAQPVQGSVGDEECISLSNTSANGELECPSQRLLDRYYARSPPQISRHRMPPPYPQNSASTLLDSGVTPGSSAGGKGAMRRTYPPAPAHYYPLIIKKGKRDTKAEQHASLVGVDDHQLPTSLTASRSGVA